MSIAVIGALIVCHSLGNYGGAANATSFIHAGNGKSHSAGAIVMKKLGNAIRPVLLSSLQNS